MYIKKSVLITCSLLLVVATALGTIMTVNPFGMLDFNSLFKFSEGVSAIKRYFYEDIDNSALVDGALLGASYSVEDPYTIYMNKEDADTFLENIESDDYTGIGLYITSDETGNSVEVVAPLAGTPAERAGLVSGDKILEVDGVVINGENIDEVATRLKGKKGTEVKIKILKKNSGQLLEMVLTRELIKRETVESKIVDGNVGHLQITQFGVNTYKEFVENYNKLVDEGMEYLVIDLRNNPGGYVEIATAIADLFVGEGVIVYTQNKHGKKREYKAEKETHDTPIALLTNGGSASASEILIGALRDHGVAKVVGEKTFGKGVTQIPYQFGDGSIMKITDSRYYTPNGVCIDKEGIFPDYEVKIEDEDLVNISDLPFEKDNQLKKAIEILKNN